MMTRRPAFLPGVPSDLVCAAYIRAGGHEIESDKLDSLESSAALVANAFGWFLERPADLPAFPPLADVEWPAIRINVERQMRFPWRGGSHPWLDAAVETQTHLIGVESKRFEPFRDKKMVVLSPAYDRDVWGNKMEPFTNVRDALRSGTVRFSYLDAAQLVKHAFGLVTESLRVGKKPVLLYLYAEPSQRGKSAIPAKRLLCHRAEVAIFTSLVSGAEVRFAACTYREWLAGWSGKARQHADTLLAHFQP